MSFLDSATEVVPAALHYLGKPAYSKNIAEKKATPVYPDAIELLGNTTTDAISLEYAQPKQTPDLLERAGGKSVVLGVLDLDTEAAVESVDQIVDMAEAAVAVVGPDKLELGSDCGMWFLPRDVCFAKISAMEQAAQVLRQRHS